MLLLSPLLIINCGIIAYQDFKDRMVVWLLFPMMGIILSLMHIAHSTIQQMLVFGTINILLVTAVILLLRLVVKLVLKKEFLNVSIGMGDLLFFYAFALGFPTITFLCLFISSILFATIISFIIRFSSHHSSVPLAGLMAVFLISIHLLSLLPINPSLYQY